ncbi:hypothetical protein ABZP36_033308 [Zizania latifolia]
MVCIGSLRALVLRAAAAAGRRRWPRVLCGGGRGAADACVTPRSFVRHGWRGLRAATGARMMLDSSSADSAASAPSAAGQVQPQRRAVGAVALAQDGGAGGYASGGWAREDGKLKCGYSSFRGKRATMEDFYDVKLTEIDGQAVSLFGVFDGHGGSRAAEYLKENLFGNLMKHPEFLTDTKLAISQTYQKTDADFLESESNALRDDGSTASTAVLVGGHLYVANVGDSRAVISKAGKALALSEDHKPNRSDERKRIENAGGVVIWAGTWRVGGVLAMSRAFGNRLLKQFVVAEPEIQEEHVNGDLECLILASDGLWDVVENEAQTTRKTTPAPSPSPSSSSSSTSKLFFSSADSSSEPRRFQYESSRTIQTSNDSRATATLETETEFDRDARAIRERQLKQAEESLKRKPSAPASTSVSGEVYKGIHGYTDYKPDICKDYKETGYCGYGDSCKFMHDRGDYKSGWQLEKDWEEAEKARKRRIAMGAGDGSDGEAGEEEDDDDDEEALPFACYICRQPFVDPVITKCKHYFCEHCALKHHSKNKKCFVCNKPTLGIFNAAQEIRKKMAQDKKP